MSVVTLVAVVAALVVLVSGGLFWLSRRNPELPPPAERAPLPPKADADADTGAASHAAPPAPAAAAPAIAVQELRDEAAPSAPRDVAGLRKGLGNARKGLLGRLGSLLSGKKDIDPSLLEELEEVLLSSDVGPDTTKVLVDRLGARLARNELKSTDAVWAALRAEATEILSLPGGPLKLQAHPTVVLMVGVNGAGKTTTIGKLATHLTEHGKRVLLGAGDTFRAAAVAQLEVWGKRVGAEVVRGKEGADPGAVAYEATARAQTDGVDVLFLDTAGRLQNKAPLMDEIRKVRKTIQKAKADAPHEVLLVVDATTGQNAMSQAKLFQEALDLTGIVLTKLDGTAKGGIVLAIADQLKVPVRYIGLGERAEDLREFHAEDFVDALFATPTADGAHDA